MGQKITIKVVFNSSKESFENFGSGRYIAHLPFEEDTESKMAIVQLLSKKMGAVPSRIEFIGVDARKNWIFELH